MTATVEEKRYKRAVYNRKYLYNVTEAQYNAMLQSQNNSCAVCKTSFNVTKPNIDHDHNCCQGTRSCGKCVRGILCSPCLTMASLVETRFKYANNMFEYLTTYLNNLMEVK